MSGSMLSYRFIIDVGLALMIIYAVMLGAAFAVVFMSNFCRAFMKAFRKRMALGK